MTKKKEEVKVEEEKVQPRTPITFEFRKDLFNKIIKAQLNNISQYDVTGVLGGVYVEIKDGFLIFCSIDGNRLLKTEIPFDPESKFEGLILSGLFLSKIKIIKGINLKRNDYMVDMLEITLNDEGMKLVDVANNISYQIPIIEGVYPKFEQLITKPPKKKQQTFALNVSYLEDLKNILVNERTNIVEFTFDKNDSLKPIVVEAENGEKIKTTSLIMPVQKR